MTGWLINGLKGIWKDLVVDKLNQLSPHLVNGIEENHENSEYLASGSKFVPETIRIWNKNTDHSATFIVLKLITIIW
jgi:hypothetical protein